jgi:hypothetical protein
MKKLFFIFLIFTIGFLFNCSRDSDFSPLSADKEEIGDLQFQFKQETPEVNSGVVKIKRGSKEYQKPIKIENNYGSVTFYRINTGSWDIEVVLYDKDGDPIYDGTATAVVNRNELTIVNIVVKRISGNLQVNVIVPELKLWNRLGSQQEVENSEVGPGLVYNQSGSGIGYPEGIFGNGIWLDNTSGGKYCIKLENQAQVLNPDAGCIEVWYWQSEPPDAFNYGIYRIWNGGWSTGDRINGVTIEVADPDETAGGVCGRLFWFDVRFGNTGESQPVNAVYLKTSTKDDAAYFNNKWTHLAFVWDRYSDEKLKVYVDGEKQTIIADTDATNLPAWVYWTYNGANNSTAYWGNSVGGSADIGSGQDSNYARKFKLDNLKVWNVPKSDFSDRFIE